jgi:LPS sulfotransferase NodH
MKRPVFVLGSPRSGTTLLYHMLLSAGGFADYRSESKVFDLLAPRFGDLHIARNKQKMLDFWFQTRMFDVSALDRDKFRQQILNECKTAGDFLRIFMERIAIAQNVDRWAECTPEHLQYLPWIKRELPDALIIHIIRDGRDVALSLQKQGWVHPFPRHRDNSLLVAGLFWEWLVGKGRQLGSALGPDYMEVHYENLLLDPRATLAKLGRFIDHDLDYDQIQRTAIGSVSKPNTSFTDEYREGSFDPVGRSRTSLSSVELAAFESLLGPFLKELNYQLTPDSPRVTNLSALKRMRSVYRLLWNLKLSMKVNTSFGRVYMRTAPSKL